MSSAVGTVAGIQYLRGLAAIFVVLAHCAGMMSYPEYFGELVIVIDRLGGFGVSIFFVISGFIITIVALQPDLSPKIGIGSFALRRFSRIVPFMWVCTIGYNILTYIGTSQVEWGPVLRALVLWPIGDLKPNVLWTLRQELQFYIIFAVLMLGSRQRPVLLALWVLLPLPMAVALDLHPSLLTDMHPYLADLIYIFTYEGYANLLFGVGMLIGVLWLRRHSIAALSVPGGFLLLAVVATGAALLNQYIYHAGVGELAYGLVVVLLAGLVVMLGIVAKPSNGALGQLGERLGDASYAIYLVHNAALLALLELSRRVEIAAPLPVIWVAFSVIAIASGFVVHYLVEVPVVRFAQRHLFRQKAVAQTA